MKLILRFITFILYSFPLFVTAQQADFRIDPPHWWSGMKNDRVQLWVYGKNISNYKLNIQSKQITLDGTTKLPNPNYLLVDLDLSNLTKPEKLKMVFFTDEDRFVKYYEFKERKKYSSKRYGVTPHDLIYLIMPDRFANGDTTNDRVEGMLEQSLNRNKMYDRHGGDLQGIEDHLDYLEELGVTALWLNPVLENDQPKTSYHGYAITDHYQVDPRLGTNEQYKSLIEKMHDRRMLMIQDFVFNHTGNEHWMIKDLPYEQWVHDIDTFGRTNYRATMLFDPYAVESEKNSFHSGWFDSHMPDLNFKTEFIRTYFIQNTIWWIEYAELDGLRIDTYAYPDQDFMNEWAQAIRKEYPKLLIFGETWVHGPGVQNYFMRNRFDFSDNDGLQEAELPNVTDFQMYYAFNNTLTKPFGWSEGVSEIFYVLAQDYMIENPEKNVIFLDNHDLSRFYSMVGEDLEKYKMGIGLLLTMRGIPQLYYGTEILMKNFSDPDGKVREDFPGGWPGDPVNKFAEEGRTDLENEAFSYVKQLANYRKNSVVLKNGQLSHYEPKDGIYVYFRYYEEENPIMVVVNTNDELKTVNPDRFYERIGSNTEGHDVVTGKVYSLQDDYIGVKGNTVLIMELKDR